MISATYRFFRPLARWESRLSREEALVSKRDFMPPSPPPPPTAHIIFIWMKFLSSLYVKISRENDFPIIISSPTCWLVWLSEYIEQTGPLWAWTERRRVVPCQTYTNPVSLPEKQRSSVGLWQIHSIVAAVPALPNVTGRFSTFLSEINKRYLIFYKENDMLVKGLTFPLDLARGVHARASGERQSHETRKTRPAALRRDWSLSTFMCRKCIIYNRKTGSYNGSNSQLNV